MSLKQNAEQVAQIAIDSPIAQKMVAGASISAPAWMAFVPYAFSVVSAALGILVAYTMIRRNISAEKLRDTESELRELEKRKVQLEIEALEGATAD